MLFKLIIAVITFISDFTSLLHVVHCLPMFLSYNNPETSGLLSRFNLSPDLDLAAITERCPSNLTGADLYALCADAMLCALRRRIMLLEEGNLFRVNIDSRWYDIAIFKVPWLYGSGFMLKKEKKISILSRYKSIKCKTGALMKVQIF